MQVALLQEVWHPSANAITVKDFRQPIVKVRQASEGGGVAILTHNTVKCVHLKEFELDDFEAVWADVKVGKVRTVVGSVYIPPGDITALDKLDTVISNILQVHSHLVVSMDANARSNLWDDSCIGISQHTPSIQMGVKLEGLISKYNLQIHNNGKATYTSGKIATAPDVTLSKGITEYSPLLWSITDYDLRSPHECLLFNIGEKVQSSNRTVIDWPKFNWAAYEQHSESCLKELHDRWNKEADVLLDDMVRDMVANIEHCVEKTATWRDLTQHSKPWIDSTISDRLKKLRMLKRRC